MSGITKLMTAGGGGVVLTPASSIASDVTVQVPSVNDTLVGLAATQTLTNKTLTNPNFDSAQVATVSGTAPLYMCRAWVNFNGSGAVSIRASGNVSSITDFGTGDYGINFSTAMLDANYATNANHMDGVTSYDVRANRSYTASMATAYFLHSGASAFDPANVMVSVFR